MVIHIFFSEIQVQFSNLIWQIKDLYAIIWVKVHVLIVYKKW